MMENRCLFPKTLLLLEILVFLLKTGQCAPKNHLAVTERLDYTSDVQTNHPQIGEKFNDESISSNKYIAVRKQLGNDRNETSKKYIPARMHNDVKDSSVPIRKYQENEIYQNTNRNASKKHTHVKRQFDYKNLFASRKHNPIRRKDDDSENAGESSNQDESGSKTDDSESKTNDSESKTDDSESKTDDSESKTDDSESEKNDSESESGSDADDSGSKTDESDSQEEDDTDSRGADEESVTKKPVWPTNTWTEVMVLFRKEVRPEKLKLSVGKDNIFRIITKALESSRATELELLKLKELLKKLRHRLDGDGGGHSDVNININAASPLGISGDVRDRKSSMEGGFLRDILHSSYARSPAVARTGENIHSFDNGLNDEMLEDEKRLFIRRGAQFLRNAWIQYKMRKHRKLYERSDENRNPKINYTVNKENGEKLNLEKREFIRKGVAFLHKAWNQYKLKKYNHL